MKREARTPFIALTAEIGWHLCCFCRHGNYIGSGYCDDEDGYYECLCPIDAVAARFDGRWLDPGDDCWAFKPQVTVSDLADFVGIILAKGWDPDKTIFWQSDNGVLHLAGLKPNERYDPEAAEVLR